MSEQLRFHVTAGKYEGQSEENCKVAYSYATIEAALEIYETVKDYPWARIECDNVVVKGTPLQDQPIVFTDKEKITLFCEVPQLLMKIRGQQTIQVKSMVDYMVELRDETLALLKERNEFRSAYLKAHGKLVSIRLIAKEGE